jgi:hypothetical protein
MTSRPQTRGGGRGTIVCSFWGGDALWSFRCNNKLEKGVINMGDPVKQTGFSDHFPIGMRVIEND